MVLRVPIAACSLGTALTLKPVEVMGLSLGETWNGARVHTVLLALFERGGWPSHGVSDGGSARKNGLVETFRAAPHRASWISEGSPCVANALQHSSAKRSLFQHLQRLCTRRRHRLQQTRCALLLPPQARAKGRLLHGSRQGEWGLQPLAYLERKARERSPEATALALALRGLKPLKMFLTPFVRQTTCWNEVMQMVNTQGWSPESMPACQERRSA